MEPIYLDYAATTPLHPNVREAMQPWASDEFGNPSSLHAPGRKARMAIDAARELVAESLFCLPGEVVFTSSGTEAANLALVGVALAARAGSRMRFLLAASEHQCVLETVGLIRSFGFTVQHIPCSPDGSVEVEEVAKLLDEDVLLVSVMHANNETGVLNDISAIADACAEVGALYHCDAVQTYGFSSLRPSLAKPDLVSLSAHKVYGPKGAGALRIGAGIKPQPLAIGGGQEREMRAGTENVAAIVGFGEAARILMEERADEDLLRNTRDAFAENVSRALGVKFTVGGQKEVLPSHCHLRIPGKSADSILINLDRLGVYASSGAACSSGSLEPSHVLMAGGASATEAGEALRFTFGFQTSEQEARYAAKALAQACGDLRGLLPSSEPGRGSVRH